MVRPVNLENVKFTGWRGRIADIVESDRFVKFIASLILLNAVILGVETYPAIMKDFGVLLRICDYAILLVFVIEITLKLYAYRLSFFRSGWNVFDFLIVAGSLIPAAGAMTVLRTLRIFRLLRLLSIVPQMRRVINALFGALPGMASIVGIMAIIFYVAAVMATKIFGTNGDPELTAMFGTLEDSMYTLFQVMTLEDWPQIAEPTLVHYPWAWLFFVVFIMVTTFAVLNLFVGIIVDAMDIVHDFEEEGQGVKDFVHKEAEDLHRDISQLRGDIDEIKD